MTDNELSLHGDDMPDDAELRARFARAYESTPASDERMIARCIREVHARATAANQPAPSTARRHWLPAAVAIAAVLLITVTLRMGAPEEEKVVAVIPAPVDSAPVGETTPVDGGVKFDLRLPMSVAAKVSVVGDFNGWDAGATPMVKSGGTGEWSAKVALLPGRHVYAFVVDGEKWVVDPLAPQVPDYGYGAANALVVEGGAK